MAAPPWSKYPNACQIALKNEVAIKSNQTRRGSGPAMRQNSENVILCTPFCIYDKNDNEVS